MENNEMGMRTNDIIASMTYYRLLKSLTITQQELNNNLLEAEKEGANIFEKGLVRTKNAVRQSNTERLNKEKIKTEATIEQFKKDCIEDTVYQYGESKEAIATEIKDFLKDDHDDYIKYQIALSCVIDNRYEHAHKEETLKDLSIILFGDENRLGQIKKQLSKNLRKLLSDQKLESVGVKALIALGVAIATTSLLAGGIAFGSAVASKNIGQILANLGHQAAQKFGKGALIATAAAATVALGGGLIALGTLTAKEIYKDEKAYKQALRDMKPQDLSATLAIKLTLVELTKDKASKDKMKEYKEVVLENADYIRSDCEYLYIVEHNDEKDSKSKADICSRAIQCLASI